MNFTDLQAKLSNYGKVKSALPILENILVTDDGEFGRSIAWTDLDNWYKVRTGRITPASIESDSTVLVPRDMYRNNPGAGWQVNLRPDDSGVDMLQYGLSGASMLVPVQDKNEYPILPDIVAIKEKCGRIALKWSDLKPALTWLKKAVSDDLTRLTLCSILVEYQHGHIDLVATNGHVLQKVELATPYQKQAGFIFSARINAAAIKFLLAIPNKAIDLVVFDSYGDADILHIYAPVDLIADNPSGSHCIEIISQHNTDAGNYPDCRQVMPGQLDMLPFNLDNVKVAIKLIKPSISKITHQVTLDLAGNTISADSGNSSVDCKFTDNGQVFKIQDTGHGTASKDFGCPLDKIGFNSKYLVDIMPKDADYILAGFTTHESAAVFQGSYNNGKDVIDNRYYALLMPLRLND